jgi:hypothetical protein
MGLISLHESQLVLIATPYMQSVILDDKHKAPESRDCGPTESKQGQPLGQMSQSVSGGMPCR